MADDVRSTFLKAYGKVLTRSWEDEAYAKQVGTNPAAALTDAGFSVPAGVNVKVSHEIPAAGQGGNVADMVARWEKDMATGSATLYLPARPSLVESELSEEQLSAVAGGASCCSIVSCCCC